MKEDFPVLVVIFGDLGRKTSEHVIPETKNTCLNNNLKNHTIRRKPHCALIAFSAYLAQLKAIACRDHKNPRVDIGTDFLGLATGLELHISTDIGVPH